MDKNEIIVFFIFIIDPLFMYFFDVILGNQHDLCFSNNIIKKLIVPKESFLRKLVVFHELKMTNPPFLYTRVIPYLIQLFIVIVFSILFFIDQLVIDFMPNLVFMIVAYASMGLCVVYQLILIFLSRGLRL